MERFYGIKGEIERFQQYEMIVYQFILIILLETLLDKDQVCICRWMQIFCLQSIFSTFDGFLMTFQHAVSLPRVRYSVVKSEMELIL